MFSKKEEEGKTFFKKIKEKMDMQIYMKVMLIPYIYRDDGDGFYMEKKLGTKRS